MKITPLLSIILAMFIGPSNCSDATRIQKKAPIVIGEVYVENWGSAISSDDSGFNLIIPITDKELQGVMLDSVFFRNQITKLTKISSASGSIYKGKFNNPKPTNDDIILSNDPMKEMANKPPVVAPKIPYDLKSTEALVSYTSNGKTLYFKIEDITERAIK